MSPSTHECTDDRDELFEIPEAYHGSYWTVEHFKEQNFEAYVEALEAQRNAQNEVEYTSGW